jgi:hypothetical protein
MGFSPFNSEFDAIGDNPPGQGVSHHLTKCRALPFNALPGTLGSDPAKGLAQSDGFIWHSQNKPDGTAIMREHRTSAFVVGAGNANT